MRFTLACSNLVGPIMDRSTPTRRILAQLALAHATRTHAALAHATPGRPTPDHRTLRRW